MKRDASSYRLCAGSANPAHAIVLRLVLLLPFLLLPGCAPRTTEIHIFDYSDPHNPRSLYQGFAEAYYQLDSAGSLKLILRNQAPSQTIPTENITQVILAETFWRPIPGATHVEKTMINAKLTYLIQSGRAARSYEGNGFVSFTERRKGELLTGKIESAVLKAAGALGDPPAPFGRARLEGQFRALRNPRRATMLMTEAQRLLDSVTPVQ